MTTGQGFSWPSAALPKIISGSAGFALTEDEQSWMVTIAFIGNVVSPIPVGYMMDKIGRKNTLLLFDITMVASWVIIYFSTNAWGLYVARFLSGIWTGCVCTAVPVFIGEVVEPKIRGAMSSIFCFMMYVGALYESLLNLCSYRLLTILSGVPPLALLIAFFLLPESPYYYLLHNNKDKAREVIIWLRESCNDEFLAKIDASVKEQIERKGKFVDLFKFKASKRAFFIVEILAIVQRGAGFTFLFAYTSITIPDSWVTAEESFIVLCLVWTLMTLGSSFVMDRFGRRFLMILSCIGSCLTMLGVSMWFFLRDQIGFDMSRCEWLPLLFLIINGIFQSFGIICIPILVHGEMYSMNIKAKFSAISCISMSVTSGITTSLYQPLNKYVGIYSNFLICAVSCLFGAIFTYLYVVETKGKSLEQIQEALGEDTHMKKPKSEIPWI